MNTKKKQIGRPKTGRKTKNITFSCPNRLAGEFENHPTEKIVPILEKHVEERKQIK